MKDFDVGEPPLVEFVRALLRAVDAVVLIGAVLGFGIRHPFLLSTPDALDEERTVHFQRCLFRDRALNFTLWFALLGLKEAGVNLLLNHQRANGRDRFFQWDIQPPMNSLASLEVLLKLLLKLVEIAGQQHESDAEFYWIMLLDVCLTRVRIT